MVNITIIHDDEFRVEFDPIYKELVTSLCNEFNIDKYSLLCTLFVRGMVSLLKDSKR